MFARGISSLTRTWVNLGCQKRLQSTSAMTYHASRTHRDTSHDIEDRDQIPRPLSMGTGGGMLKIRFDRYISSHYTKVYVYERMEMIKLECTLSS